MNRRLRAVSGMAAAWSAVWTLAFLALAAAQWIYFRSNGVPDSVLLSGLLRKALGWALFGTVGGVLFALALIRAGRRVPSFGALSMRRAAWSGAAIGLAVNALWLIPGFLSVGLGRWAWALLFIACSAAIGAASAVAVLAVARRESAALRPA